MAALQAQMMAVQHLASPPTLMVASGRLCRSVKFPMGPLRKPVIRRRAGVARASGMAEPESAGTGGSGMVDSNMMVLRQRMRSIRLQEGCDNTPADWADWERNAYAGYRADICLLLSAMQGQLLTMRPGTVLFLVSVLMTVLPVMSVLFVSALATQFWSLHCALLELGASLH